MLAPSRPANATVATSIINKCWSQVDPPMPRSRPLLINVCQHTVNESTIQSTRAGLGRCHLAFADANSILNWRFAMAAVGSCGACWKLQQVAGEACNMTANALFILIIFSVQLQQTEISDRKPFILHYGGVGKHNASS